MKRTSVSQQIRLQDLAAATQRLAERREFHDAYNKTGKHLDPTIQLQARKSKFPAAAFQRAVTRLPR